jgi:hypothetical protein
MDTEFDPLFSAAIRKQLAAQVTARRPFAPWRRRTTFGAGAVLVLLLAGTAGATAAGLIGAPAPEESATYGSADHHSSSQEERALTAIAKTIRTTDAFGYYRRDARTLVVRLPPTSTAHLPATTKGFTIVSTTSRFTSNARLQAALAAVRAILDRPTSTGSGEFSYDAKSDLIEVSESWSEAVTHELNQVDGVHAVRGAGIDEGPEVQPSEQSSQGTGR